MNFTFLDVTGDELIVCADHLKHDKGIITGRTYGQCAVCAVQAINERNCSIASNPFLKNIMASDIVYLSGPMSGIKELNVAMFNYWEGIIKRTSSCVVLSPAKQQGGMSYEWYMTEDIKLVLKSTVVVMLPGWELSQGATVERNVALITGKKVYNIIV